MSLDRIINDDDRIIVSIDKTKYKNSDVKILQKWYPHQYNTMELCSVKDDDGYINYQFNCEDYNQFNLDKFTVLEKLMCAYSLFQYESLFKDGFYVSLNDSNVFLTNANTIRLVFVEKFDLYKYDEYDNQDYFVQLKARILAMFSQYSFDEIIKSDFTLNFKTPFEKAVLETKDVIELKAVINKYIKDKKAENQQSFSYVKRKNYVVYRMLTFIFLICFMLSAGFLSYTKIIVEEDLNFANELYSEFIKRNYSKVIVVSRDEELTKEQKYIVGYSAIMTSALDGEKRQVILSTYSQNVSESILDYWVSIGYGDYATAINKGKAVNNDEYVLYALRLEENRLLTNDKMDGSEKEAALESVRTEIEAYEKKLMPEEGVSNE